MTHIEKIKNHLKENYKIYIALGAGVVIGGAVVYFTKSSPTTVNIGNGIANQIKIESTIGNLTIQAPGNSGNILLDDLGNLYASQNAAAKALGVDKRLVSSHLHGDRDHVMGRTLTKVLDGSPQHTLTV